MPDLLAGSTILALDTPVTVQDIENGNVTGFSGTTFAQGSPVCGVAFVAPTTGRVWITWGGSLESNGNTDVASMSFGVRTGTSIGSGTDVITSDSERAVQSGAGTNLLSRVGSSRSYLLTGLTPGSDYNAVTEHAMSGATDTGDIFNRFIIVAPAT